ncbi:Uncharacterised protein [Prevotella disiens]|uniref:Mobilization protein n=3 Tax=Prevotella disiens TaxID=28130 RepID=E1KU49_9BACT|nr:mobilization protein [Prevotella disiens FB035-09AN]SUB84880.1 Uncharacterised protein [Prevotella disiens]
MGYCVLHLEKAKGVDSGMSAHIERTIVPKNIDTTRTHLNRELIRFPDGVCNRTAAIRHRLDTGRAETQDREEPSTGNPHRAERNARGYGTNGKRKEARRVVR